MNYKLIHRMTAGIVFLISLVQFALTVQPTVSFWDCGEFIAAGYSLQVPHPPGAPLFLLLGRLFSMLPIDANIGLKVNWISVLSSALSVLLVYLVAIKLIEGIKGKTPKDLLDGISTYAAAATGALSLSFSDTFWFNGVEAEVYAASTFLFALITWLMMLWYDKADNKDNEKYLIMIAYLVGLSTGVHLMSVLAIVPVVMVVMFRKYVQDDEACRKTGYIFLAHSAIIFVIALLMWSAETGNTPPMPDVYKAFDNKFKMIAVAISIAVMAIFRKQIFNRNSFYLPLIIGGIALFVTYPGVVKILPSILLTISGNDAYLATIVFAVILGAVAYGIFWSMKNNKQTLNLVIMSFLFIVLGFTTYAMVIIRANQQPPMNENEPNDFAELVSYLNREQYGDFPTFKRRFTTEAHQMKVYNEYSSDLNFFWKYQMDHMFNRYLGWNYIGREGWDQDQGVDFSQFYAIPFLLGLLGIFYHFRKDWKMASVFMVMFIFMGYLTAFYQNQQEPQPRERDYFYVGAFFVYSIWIALGVKGLVDLILELVKSVSLSKALSYAVIVLAIIFVPVKMAASNWFTHDRSRNWVAWDYSYNLLQSCAPNAVLFTNGDNDTFPLWYLQDVEGVRRDVRVANLSLLNTEWYIKQLKNTEPYGAKKVAISLSDAQIDMIEPVQWQPRTVNLPISKDILDQFNNEIGKNEVVPSRSFAAKYGQLDSATVKNGFISFKMNPTLNYGNYKLVRVQDLMVKDIVESNKWQRPIYFAVTTSEDSKIGLQDYLIYEGLAHRLVPFKAKAGNDYFIDETIMRKQLFEENPSYSKDYKPGFKFRGLNDSTIFFDENHERLTFNYRNAFLSLAVHYLYDQRNNEMAIKTLDEMEAAIPNEIVAMPERMLLSVAGLYLTAGAVDKYQKMSKGIEVFALNRLKANPYDVTGNQMLIELYSNSKEYDKVISVLSKLQQAYPNDPSIKSGIQRYKMLASQMDSNRVN